MQQPLPNEARVVAAPRFYLTARRRLHPGVILLAIVAAVGVICGIAVSMAHTRVIAARDESMRSGSASSKDSAANDDDDDPNQIDTIVLGDPADAPVPARRGNHVSPVHPTILVRLPRYGDQTGLIPDSPAGHLLYDWLAAFNQTSHDGLVKVLPTLAGEPAAALQLALRNQTGGFTLVSAKEVQPGVLVFRLHDQTPQFNEVLGTLQMRPNSSPPAIMSFSLRAVPGRSTTTHKGTPSTVP